MAGDMPRDMADRPADDEVFGPIAEVGEEAARFCQAVAKARR